MVVALGLLEEPLLERLALGLAGETDPRAAVPGLALQRAELALRDRRRGEPVVLLFGEQMPGQDGQLASGRAERDLLAAPRRDPGVERAQRARGADRGVRCLDQLNRPGFLGDSWPWRIKEGVHANGARSWEADDASVFA